MTKRGGFTLIELLVVIAVIGLLASIVLVSVNNARSKARDVRRLSDVHQIVLALEIHNDTYNQYPNNTDDDCGGWDTGYNGAGDPFISDLVTTNILTQVPGDPASAGSCGGYRYYRYPAGNNDCSTANGYYYVLGIATMETADKSYTPLDGDPVRTIHESSPGWHCPEDTGTTRDWQSEFYWVTGSFE